MKVIFSRECDADFEEIGDYIARDNPVRAESFILELRNRCLSLSDMPRRFAAVWSEGDEIRRLNHGNYAIIYTVNSDHVRIARVIHGARLNDLRRFKT